MAQNVTRLRNRSSNDLSMFISSSDDRAALLASRASLDAVTHSLLAGEWNDGRKYKGNLCISIRVGSDEVHW